MKNSVLLQNISNYYSGSETRTHTHTHKEKNKKRKRKRIEKENATRAKGKYKKVNFVFIQILITIVFYSLYRTLHCRKYFSKVFKQSQNIFSSFPVYTRKYHILYEEISLYFLLRLPWPFEILSRVIQINLLVWWFNRNMNSPFQSPWSILNKIFLEGWKYVYLFFLLLFFKESIFFFIDYHFPEN